MKYDKAVGLDNIFVEEVKCFGQKLKTGFKSVSITAFTRRRSLKYGEDPKWLLC